MITVTGLNHVSLVLNADLIEYMEATPDTIITLTTGQKIMVRETAEEVLFAFFVVMYAWSQSDKARAAQVSESIRHAFDRSAVASILGGTINEKGQGNAMMKGPGGAEKASQTKDGVFAELLPSLNFLEKELQKEIAAGKMQVRLEARGLVVSLREAAFFPPARRPFCPTCTAVWQKSPRLSANSRIPSGWRATQTRSRFITNDSAVIGRFPPTAAFPCWSFSPFD